MQYVQTLNRKKIITHQEMFPCNPIYPLHTMQINNTKLHINTDSKKKKEKERH